ncbi:MAG: BatA domain-containing protein [Verrucomicrobiales bacterium]
MIIFANPLGLLALLGIPVVLAIHFLQRQAKVLPVSTLFLLEKTQRESASGRQFDRLMNSIPLWMQLLGVAILSWILAEPRYQKSNSIQRVALVLDTSASMSVFKESLVSTLGEKLPEIQGNAAQLEMTFLQSNPAKERLYSGNSIEHALAALEDWNPREGISDPSSALRIGRSLVGKEGILIYATDTLVEASPYESTVLSVGKPVDNVGIAGLRVQQEEGADVWSVVVRNYGDDLSTRAWQLRFPDGSASEPKPFELAPRSMVSIQGALPKEYDRAVFSLSSDSFSLDDQVPMIRPQPKSIAVFGETVPEIRMLTEKITRSLDAVIPASNASEADFTIASYDPLDPILPTGDAAIFVNDGTQAGAYLKGGIVAESHPLVQGLNWQALLLRESIQLERAPSDDVLLWQGTRPLIFLRELKDAQGRIEGEQLCFNFDLRLSNAAQQPAFIICLHRYIERIRRKKIAEVRANLETGQPIEIAANVPIAGEITSPLRIQHKPIINAEGYENSIPADPRVSLTTPENPGFLSVSQGGLPLLQAAVYFADTREADFSACASGDTFTVSTHEAVRRHTREDHLWRIWVLLLLASLIVSWRFSKGGMPPSKTTGSASPNEPSSLSSP